MRYRKKPVEIEAFQFQPSDTVDLETIGLELASWCNGLFVHSVPGNPNCEYKDLYHVTHRYCPACDYREPEYPSIQIKTLEGQMEAVVGDWVIKGVKGEFYPCKPDIFEATYEFVGA